VRALRGFTVPRRGFCMCVIIVIHARLYLLVYRALNDILPARSSMSCIVTLFTIAFFLKGVVWIRLIWFFIIG